MNFSRKWRIEKITGETDIGLYWEVNIKTGLSKKRSTYGNWNQLSQVRVKCRAFTNTVINCRIL
jgi:hypothetical protein